MVLVFCGIFAFTMSFLRRWEPILTHSKNSTVRLFAIGSRLRGKFIPRCVFILIQNYKKGA